MKQIPLDQVSIVSYQDSISGESHTASYTGETLNFWIHLEYFPQEVTEVYLLEDGDERPHPQVNWAYARGMLR